MVENNLTRDLRDYLAQRFQGYTLPTKQGVPREPIILNGNMRQKRTTSEEDFPFIMVRLDSGNTDSFSTWVNVSIIIGCFSEDYDGQELCLNVMAKIRQVLCDLPNGTLSEKYQIRTGISWELYPDQPWPYWQLDMKTQWMLAAPKIKEPEYIIVGDYTPSMHEPQNYEDIRGV